MTWNHNIGEHSAWCWLIFEGFIFWCLWWNTSCRLVTQRAMRVYGNPTNETKSGNYSFRTGEKIIGLVYPTLSSDPLPAVKHGNQASVGTSQKFHSLLDAIGLSGGSCTNSRLYEPACARCSLPLFTHIMRCCCVGNNGKTQTSSPQQNCHAATEA